MRFLGSRLVFAMFLLVFASGCAGGNNVYFFPQADQSQASKVSKLHIDAFGNLYPSAGLPADFDADQPYGGGLYNLMVYSKVPLAGSGPKLCDTIQKGTAAETLCEAAQKTPCNSAQAACVATRSWRIAQTALWKDAAASVFEASHRQTNDPQIVVLVHGYNNTEAEAAVSYASVRQRIAASSSAPGDIHFVEIYWDGFSSFTDWSNKAQKERDIIAEYLSEHKDCCAILEPAYLRENWNGELVEVFYNEGEMRNWNKDFQIASDPQWFGVFGDEIVPGSGNYSSEYKISACGIIGEINRG